jgi:hypothetical protein
VKRSQKFIWELQDGICKLNPKCKKKIAGTTNQPIRTKISQKKIYLVTQKCKRAKNSYGDYPTEFAGSTHNPKKIIRIPNLPIKTKNFPKKICLVP